MQKKTFRGGIHLCGKKERTSNLPTVPITGPEKVYIPLSQHAGKPSAAVVKAGDQVKKGQKIGESQGFVSVPIHASVSGTVVAIEKKAHPNGFIPCIVIENDGKEEWSTEVQSHPDPENISPEEIRKIVQDKGIVGLGGAAFPAHVKYAPVEGKKAAVVIINGIECEPYITSDHRTMLEKSERIVAGLRYIMKSLDCNNGIIAIEDNKMDAVAVMKKAAERYADIQVFVLPEKYPQGSEKQLIYACTKKEVPAGGLPLDAGAVVNNVGTAAAIADAIELGIPLIERIVTLTGDGIKNPGNYLVKFGTLFKDLIAQSGGYTHEVYKIIAGGPMMGRTVFTDDMPVIKGTSGILVLKNKQQSPATEYNCVRCGKCIDACPIFLEPTTIVKYLKAGQLDNMESNHVMNCIECGACTYVCPANIPLVQYLRRAKQIILSAKAKAMAKQ